MLLPFCSLSFPFCPFYCSTVITQITTVSCCPPGQFTPQPFSPSHSFETCTLIRFNNHQIFLGFRAGAQSESMRGYSLLWIPVAECSSGTPPAQSYTHQGSLCVEKLWKQIWCFDFMLDLKLLQYMLVQSYRVILH